MRGTLKFLLALSVSLLVMLVFRALFFTIYAIGGPGLEPVFRAGDRVMVNRWSYGLRTGGEGLFNYGRLCRQSPAVGDYVAFEDSLGEVMIGRCTALPGDTVQMKGKGRVVLASKAQCATYDYYFVDRGGMVAENRIIGRVVMVLYHHQSGSPFWRGYSKGRFLTGQ